MLAYVDPTLEDVFDTCFTLPHSSFKDLLHTSGFWTWWKSGLRGNYSRLPTPWAVPWRLFYCCGSWASSVPIFLGRSKLSCNLWTVKTCEDIPGRVFFVSSLFQRKRLETKRTLPGLRKTQNSIHPFVCFSASCPFCPHGH